MIPIGDDISGRTLAPIVNHVLIAANVAVFVLLQVLAVGRATR